MFVGRIWSQFAEVHVGVVVVVRWRRILVGSGCALMSLLHHSLMSVAILLLCSLLLCVVCKFMKTFVNWDFLVSGRLIKLHSEESDECVCRGCAKENEDRCDRYWRHSHANQNIDNIHVQWIGLFRVLDEFMSWFCWSSEDQTTTLFYTYFPTDDGAVNVRTGAHQLEQKKESTTKQNWELCNGIWQRPTTHDWHQL